MKKGNVWDYFVYWARVSSLAPIDFGGSDFAYYITTQSTAWFSPLILALIFSLFNLKSDIFNENHWTAFKNSKNWEYYSHLSISYLRAQKIRLDCARLAVWQISSFGRVQWKKVSWVSNLLSAKTRLFWKKRRKYQKKNSSKLIVLILNKFNYNIVNC